MMPACVIKLGGSLVGTPHWRAWLARILMHAPGRAIVVPGGGPWADDVREAQRREGFDDGEAHRRALRAMEIHGREICAGDARFAKAANPAGIEAALSAGNVAVWMPHDMAMADGSIAQSWAVTSDSLAAWLARMLGAPLLMLMKSVEHVDAGLSIAELARREWVDASFERFCESAAFRVAVLGKGDVDRFARELAGTGTESGRPGFWPRGLPG